MKIIFLGSQGSGKSTQAKLMAQKLNLPYIEMGQLLRDKSKKRNTEAGEIRQALEVGDLVSDAITVKTLRSRLAKSDCKYGFVLDGYPRNYAQLEGLPRDIDRVFFFKVSDEEAIERLIKRGRHDDTLDIITRRLEVYHKDSEPLIAYFKEQGILEEINGSATIESIRQDLAGRIQNENAKGK
ncbi:nucleoside monophosphate kinase [Candidatus Curtissbacteria bacterium]|nr:nucleoside monophosphate kinase [Candidatus Curtissbacteria bacterium]